MEYSRYALADCIETLRDAGTTCIQAGHAFKKVATAEKLLLVVIEKFERGLEKKREGRQEENPKGQRHNSKADEKGNPGHQQTTD